MNKRVISEGETTLRDRAVRIARPTRMSIVLAAAALLAVLVAGCADRGGGAAEEAASSGAESGTTLDAAKAESLARMQEIEYVNQNLMIYFDAYRLEHPDADIYPVSWGADRQEDEAFLAVDCDGVDLPAFEAAGFLPDFVRLNYDREKFDQKRAEPLPHEPESTCYYDGGMTALRMDREEYPLYPDYVSFTVSSKERISYGSFRIEKYAEGEWHNVRSLYGDFAMQYWIDEGETKLTVPLEGYSRLGEGLYRLYLKEGYWVEFSVLAGAEPLEPAENTHILYFPALFYRLLPLPEHAGEAWESKSVCWPLAYPEGTRGSEEHAGEVVESVTPLKAFQVLLPVLETWEEPLTLRSFAYAFVKIGEDSESLRPCWQLTVWLGQEEEPDEIRSLLVDAVSGELIEN